MNLDEVTTVKGTPLGWEIRPGAEWSRVRWAEYLQRHPEFRTDRTYPPSDRWLVKGSWPASIEPPPEGSLDEESFAALVSVLARDSPAGQSSQVVVLYAHLPSGDFDQLHVWTGWLGDMESLIGEGRPYSYSPTNFWAADGSWFVWTDYDLQGTKISGSSDLIQALRDHPDLEVTDWAPSEAQR